MVEKKKVGDVYPDHRNEFWYICGWPESGFGFSSEADAKVAWEIAKQHAYDKVEDLASRVRDSLYEPEFTKTNSERENLEQVVETTCGHSQAAARGIPGDLEIYCAKCKQVLRDSEESKEPQSNATYYECGECGGAVPHGQSCSHNLHG